MTSLIPSETIERRILLIRDQKVMLDTDLAELYGVETRVLIQALKRNLERFPDDFMFQLTDEEFGILRSQSVISRWGGRRYAPYVFTEQGVTMLSSVLNSDRAIKVNPYGYIPRGLPRRIFPFFRLSIPRCLRRGSSL